MLENLGWRSLQQRRADACLSLFYRIVYGLAAIPMPEYIQPNTRVSKYCHSIDKRNTCNSLLRCGLGRKLLTMAFRQQTITSIPFIPGNCPVKCSPIVGGVLANPKQLVSCTTPGRRSRHYMMLLIESSAKPPIISIHF